jgi:DNA-binding NarL/FixJ family response regulator
VAALIAQGATNREIAARLTLSPHTVERHVEHILNRLGLSSRTQVAVWAAQQGPQGQRGAPGA